MRPRPATLALVLVGLVACQEARTSTAAVSAAPALASVRLEGIPHVRQKPDFCGEACAEMVLRQLGHQALDQEHVFDQAGVDPALGRGAVTRELKRALERIGFQVGPTWHQVPAAESGTDLAVQFMALHADLVAGVPSIVCMRYDGDADATEHFRLVVGYDARTDEVLYHEPAEDRGAYRRMTRTTFLQLWPLKYSADTWTLVRLRMTPGTIQHAPAAAWPAPADVAQHVLALKRRLPPSGFHVVYERPFVVVGDLTPEQLRFYAARTIRPAVRFYQRAYFPEVPERILDIWLFRDEASYRKYTKAIFNDEPDTPFGYYSSAQGALVMNIDTGGGTLLHEIVHPFVEANFPKCPAWLNEGLGSLYEQTSIRGDTLVGLTNWRLPGLQESLQAGTVPSFRELTGFDESQFYGGDNYGPARYLCYYLQEQGLLRRFYHEFHRNRASDPTGYQTLQRVLGNPDMGEFRKTWEAFVMRLRFE